MIDLFFSYAHQDEAMRNELEVHLAMLKRSGVLRSWHDRRITAGADLEAQISQHIETADVILLLLSPYFLASDYCYEREAQRALERHDEGSSVVIPVILQPCDWLSSPFRKLRATPADGKPVAKYPNIHDAFLEVTHDIRAAAESLDKGAPEVMIRSSKAPARDLGVRTSNLRLKKSFTDRDKDVFRDDTFAYIEKFFENSLAELRDRNPAIEFRFKRLSATAFNAAVYVGGTKKTACHIWLAETRSFGVDIAYSASDTSTTNSMNDGVRIEDDGYQLGLRTSGLNVMGSSGDNLLTPHGAAEYFWATFIAPLQ
jgi:hypothetical protein